MRDNTPLDIGGLQIDPGMLAELSRTAVVNQAALSTRQRREQARISLRIDLEDAWLRDRLAEDAAREDVSISHLARFLLTWAWSRYHDGDPDLQRLIEENRYVYRSLRSGHGLDTDCLRPALRGRLRDDIADSAEAPNGAL